MPRNNSHLEQILHFLQVFRSLGLNNWKKGFFKTHYELPTHHPSKVILSLALRQLMSFKNFLLKTFLMATKLVILQRQTEIWRENNLTTESHKFEEIGLVNFLILKARNHSLKWRDDVSKISFGPSILLIDLLYYVYGKPKVFISQFLFLKDYLYRVNMMFKQKNQNWYIIHNI